MRAPTLLTIFLCLALCWQTSSHPNFEEYLVMFSKQYSPTEYPIRKKLYDDRVASFAKIVDFQPGVNERSDWSQAEIQASKTLLEVSDSQQVSTPVRLSSDLLGAPASLDWRDSNVITSIKNQGTCGACWTFATAAYAESKLLIQSAKYTVESLDLSQQFLLRCTPNSDCNGGYFENVFPVAYTLPLEVDYPYAPYSSNSGICSASGIRVGYQTKSYYSLTDDQLISLLQTSPVAISVASDGWQNYASGIFTCTTNAVVNHAVLLIGYTPDYWIVKNQWSARWGESGFIRITRDNTRNCKIGHSVFVMWELRVYGLGALVVMLLLAMAS